MKSTLLFCFCFVFISFGVLGKVGKNCPAGIPLCRCRRKGVVICKKTDCLQRLPTGNITLEEGRQITSIVVSRQRSFEIIRSRDLTVLPNLKSARFFNNGIYAVLRGAFSYTPNIERLDLHKNRLSAIPHEIKSLRHLRQLNLGGNEISSIRYDAFSGNPSLQKLILKRNKLETFPGSLPPSLVKISIGGNLIPSFGDLRYLSNLKILRAEFNRLTTIGSSSLPPSLAELSICSNALSSDGLDVSNLTRLKRLRLGGNVGIGPITREMFFKGANRLRELEIGHSNIDVIEPDSFACMRHLVAVDIGGNSLHTVDQELFTHNENLRRVMVSGNPLQCDCLLVSTLESLNQRLLRRFPREIDGSPRSSAVDLDHVVCADVDMRLKVMEFGESSNNYSSLVKSRCVVQEQLYNAPTCPGHLVSGNKRPRTDPVRPTFPATTRRQRTTTRRTTTRTTTVSTTPPQTTTTPPQTTTTPPPTTTTPPPTTTTPPPTTTTPPPTTTTPPPTTTTPPPTTTTTPPPTTTLATTTTVSTSEQRYCTDDAVQCIIPFEYEGVTYHECAPYSAGSSYTWCYTDAAKNWDYCADCPES